MPGIKEFYDGATQRELSRKYNINERIRLKTKLTPLEKRSQYVAQLNFSAIGSFFVLSAQFGTVQVDYAAF